MLRLAIAGLLALVCYPVHAVDLAGIEAATLMLYNNGRSVCTTQVVHSEGGETVLLVAHHCVDGGGEFSIRQDIKVNGKVASYTVYMADVIKQDAKNELAVLRLRDTQTVFPATDIASLAEVDKTLFKGAEVLAAGYPGTRYAKMEDLVFTDGLYVGRRASFVPSVEVDVIRTTIPIWYGNSGGALYAKIGEEWKLVGVASQIDPETPWMTSLFIPVDAIEKILVGAWAGTVPPPDPGVVRQTLRNK
jgi:S1-C subfamily serine protease